MIKRFLLSFWFLGLIPSVYADTNHDDPGYTKDKNGRTLIFRQELGLGDIVAPPFLIAFGSVCLYIATCAQTMSRHRMDHTQIPLRTIDRLLWGGLGSASVGIGIGALYKVQHSYRDRDKPLIILHKKGIWHENWQNTILWTDIEHITLEKVNQIEKDEHGTEWDRGFFWKIHLKTKSQKTFVIDERTTRMGKVNRVVFFERDAGGELGQLILQYYNDHALKIP